MRWERTARTVYSDGASDTTYTLMEYPFIEVQSRKRMIPHANGIGAWPATEYFVVKGNVDVSKYRRLRDAKEAAEKIALEMRSKIE